MLNNTIPVEVSSLSALQELRLGSNQLTGELPELPSGLIELDVQYNRLSGPLPLHLSDQDSLELLILSNYSFTGTIPTQYGTLGNLFYFHAPNNRLNGTLPSELGSLLRLVSIDVSDNISSGTIPSSLALWAIYKSLTLQETC